GAAPILRHRPNGPAARFAGGGPPGPGRGPVRARAARGAGRRWQAVAISPPDVTAVPPVTEPRTGQAEGTTRPDALERAASNRAWTSAQFTMFQIALT